MAVAWTQANFRARNDDGSQTTATFIAALNTNWTQLTGVTFRIRFDVTESGTTASTHTGQLMCNKNGGAFQNVTTSSTIVKAVTSANFTDDAATTQQIGAGTFVAGKMDSTGVTTATGSIAQNSHTEMEYCVQINTADVANGDTIILRDTQNGTAFGTYTQVATATARITPVPSVTDAVTGAEVITGTQISFIGVVN